MGEKSDKLELSSTCASNQLLQSFVFRVCLGFGKKTIQRKCLKPTFFEADRRVDFVCFDASFFDQIAASLRKNGTQSVGFLETFKNVIFLKK